MLRTRLSNSIILGLLLTFHIYGQADTTTQTVVFDSVSVAAGKNLFTSCAACHALDKKVIGPALKDVHKKYEQSWLIKFIRNSQELVKQGEPQALAVYNDYNQLVMPSHDFSDTEILQILDYIAAESHLLETKTSQKEAISRPSLPLKINYQPLYPQDHPIFWVVISSVIGFLILILYFIIKISNIIKVKKQTL